MLQNKIET